MTKYGKEAQQTLVAAQLAPHKKFGQNFLVHRQTAEAIVRAAEVTEDETIIEVGVGLGAMTLPLANAARQVIAFEIDSGLVRYHQDQGSLPGNVSLIHQDILRADFAALHQTCGKKLKIVANLPYSITNPFIMKLIDNRQHVSSATIMVQKEVADRLAAQPRTKDYGIPTVLLGSCARVKPLLKLKPAEFHPRPKIDSMVIGISFFVNDQNVATEDSILFEFFRTVVRTTFNQRRKTIENTLSNGLSALREKMDKQQARELVKKAVREVSLDPAARPETLTVSDFWALSRTLMDMLHQH